MGYLLEYCLLDSLTNEVIDRCQPYKCSKDPDIDSFFHKNNKDNFSDYRTEMMGYSHCFYTDDKHPRMVCAFSLSNTALRIDTLPKNKRNKFNRNIPNAKRRSQYPAILIGQLCVFDGFSAKAINESVADEMMNLIKTMAISTENNCAARYLVVDALNQSNVIEYYKRNGFEYLFDSDEEELTYLRNNKKPNSIDQLFQSSRCKTRLMLFDLVLLKQ